MKNFIENFNIQFSYKPIIENSNNFKPFRKFIVAGMGGSHLAADLLKTWKPELDIIIHEDYSLPAISSEELKSRLFIASSYSGNTEEIIDSLTNALDNGASALIIAVGGKLLDIAKSRNLPYIQLPNTPNLEPRNALGFSFNALLKAMGEKEALEETAKLAETLKPKDFEEEGKKLAKILKEFVPIIYSSTRNMAIAYNWKIKFNETGKIPAFYNVLPELNHNEMTGFDVKDKSRALSEKFRFIFLDDSEDHPKIQKRMSILKRLYEDRGLKIEIVELNDENIFLKIFSSLVLADWTAYYTALEYNLEPAQVPMVEEFKKLIA